VNDYRKNRSCDHYILNAEILELQLEMTRRLSLLQSLITFPLCVRALALCLCASG